MRSRYHWLLSSVFCVRFYMVSCFFFEQTTAYEMRIRDWSSDVCSSDLYPPVPAGETARESRSCVPRSACRRSRRSAVGRRRHRPDSRTGQIGRASCRERGCTYVYISVVAVCLKKKTKQTKTTIDKQRTANPLKLTKYKKTEEHKN